MKIDDDGIEILKELLTFLGYTTPLALSKLAKKTEMKELEIEFQKYRNAAAFERNPRLKNFEIASGTKITLSEIAKAAAGCLLNQFSESDQTMVLNETVKNCQKVRLNGNKITTPGKKRKNPL